MAARRGSIVLVLLAAIPAALVAFLIFNRDGEVDRPTLANERPSDSERSAGGGSAPEHERAAATAAAPAASAADAATSAPAAAKPASARGSVRVRVLDAGDGMPVFGASITVVDGRITRSNTTNADGEGIFPELVEPRCSVLVSSPGRDDARAEFVAERATESLVVVRMRPWKLLHGVVRSSRDGRPVKGASITLGLESNLPEALQGAGVRSSDDGRFALPRPPDRTALPVFVTADGFVAASLQIGSGRGSAESAPTVVELDPAGCIRGVVKDRDGAPVEGARVAIWPADGSWTRHELRIRQVENATEVMTDGGGGFRFEDRARGGVYRIRAWSGGQTGPRANARVFLPPDDPEAAVELVLGGTGNLRVGWSPATPSGQRVMVAILAAGDDVEPLGMEVASEPPIEFDSLPEGGVAVRVWSGGSGGDASAEVVPGATTDVSVALRAGVSIEGIVRDSAGAPASGVRVVAELTRSRDESTSPSLAVGDVLRSFGNAVTDAAGRFRIDDLPDGVHVEVRATAKSRPVPVTAPATDVVLVLTATGDLRGRLLTPGGGLLPERMTLVLESADGGSWAMPQDLRGGFFRLSELPVGKYRFSAIAGSFVLSPRDVEVPAGKAADLGVLTMVEAPQTLGIVRDGSGAPLVGARVRVLGPTHAGLWGITIDSGRFVLGGLPPGKYVVWVEARDTDSMSQHVVEVGARGADVVLTHLSGGILRGVVRDPRGVPFAGAVVLLSPAAGGEVLSRDWVDHVGRYRLRAPAGEHRVEVRENDRILAEGRATVTEGGEAILDLVGER